MVWGTFDELNRITQIEHSDNANTVLASFTYTINPTGRRTQITEEDARTSSYTYDDLYRLAAEDIIDPVNGNHNATWTYDAVGNRLSDTTSGVTTSYSYDANDRLLTQGSQSFTYDDRGSTLSESDGITTDTFVYDSRNKLVETMVEGSLLTLSYDMDGNRVGKTRP